jgi:hypothetical protein
MAQTPPRPREWDVDLVAPIIENGQLVGHELDREACSQALMELDSILFRLGGAAVVAAKREEQDDGSWVTTGLRVSYQAFMPPTRRQEAPPAVPSQPEEPPAPPQPEPAVVSPEPAQPGPDEPGPPPVSVAAGTEPREEAELEPAGE